MTRIDANYNNSYFKNEQTAHPGPQNIGVDQLIDQIKSEKNNYLNLDLKQLKQKDATNVNTDNINKLWTWGCLQTKGGVHCPTPRDPKPTPTPQPQPKPNNPS